ncbi:MAG: class I SAM-dependent methyltransferase [Dehalococcoidia bacterium]|nr:class I SAM-dependent methyltransferase [Dehalococcoidia bacterium]MDH4366595.1 class I SAM-dependent methyltransferase [Dehalococcoidia bacterium]
MRKMLFTPAENVKLDEPISYAEYQKHINRYIFASKFVQNKAVLDVACGAGTGSRYLVNKGAGKVVGVDISQEAIREAKTRNERGNEAEFVLSDAESLPFPSHFFGVVVSFETIEHLKEPERFLFECARVIKKGGIFICSTPNKRIATPLFRRPSNPFHVKEFYPQEFFELVGRYFSDAVAYGQCTLNLKDKLRLQTIGIIARILSTLPGGNRIRGVLRTIGRPILEEPYLPMFGQELDRMQDESYQVSPFQSSLLGTPECVIVVAKARQE